MERDDLALFIAQKLGEVPRDLLRLLYLTVIKRALAAQISVELTCFRTIYIRLCQDRGLEILVKDKLTNLCRGARLLTTELIARYGNYFETLLIILPMQLNHFFVVQIG